MTMSILSPIGRALVLAGRRAFQPTDADRLRLLGVLSFQLGILRCRPAWVSCRPRPMRKASHWRGRALLGGRAR